MKNAAIALILDSRGGMRFNGRRQMKDPVLIDELVARYGGGGIFISPSSARLFEKFSGVTVTDDPVSSCCEGGLCFIEDSFLASRIGEFSRAVICSWRTAYPADEFFGEDLEKLGFVRISSERIVTPSHDKIICDVYEHACLR